DLGPAANRPYLDYDALEKALVETGADAAWVGWGFVAEDPDFADLCRQIGVTFIGPSPEAMRKLGDKIGSKLIAEEVGVPVAPWSRGGVDTLDEAKAAAARVGYPLMLKATAGGGGRGIRTVSSDDELTEAYERTRAEAERAFGSGVVFLERLVTGARHVEVQVIADGYGTAWAIGVRDCAIHRRNQKVLEESASPVLDDAQAAELRASAERLAVAVGYAGAGTVEFLYQPDERLFSFLEVNTRLQVEHPVTEVTTDTDLVKLQLHVASGGRLDGDRPVEIGHAVEARLNAEDPDRDFAPSPGRISVLDLPSGPGVRVDTGVGEGDSIPAEFDSMIAKIIARGRDRDEALARLRRAMTETTVVIEGGSTNKSFVLDLLAAPEVIDGSADTGWIDRVRTQGRLVAHRHSGVALVAAGVETYETEEAIERTRLIETARGGRPQVQHETGRVVDLKLRGSRYKVMVSRIGPDRFRVRIIAGTTEYEVDTEVDRIDRHRSRITVGGRTHRMVTATHGPVHLVEVDGVSHRVSLDEGGVLRSPVPALVVAAPVGAGDEVDAGAATLVLESMKMETVLPSPFTATVKDVLVSVGSQVETGAPLVRLEPVGDGDDDGETVRPAVDLELPTDGSLRGDPAARAARHRNDLFAMLLGYDVDPRDDGRTLAAYLDERDRLVAAGDSPHAEELALTEAFADFVELSRNRPAGEDLHLENRVHSPREHFHTYLQSLDPERGALPSDFRAKLGKVLEHYGVADLARTPELEQAVFRIFLAQQRSTPDVALVTALLQRWLVEPAPEAPLDGAVRDALDRLVTATQLRFPVVGDLARSVRFQWFDQPLVDAERQSVLGGVRDELVAIAGMPSGRDRDDRLDELAAIPEQLVRFLADRIGGPDLPGDEPMLAVLIKRHYRKHSLRDLREVRLEGRPFAVADYTLDDRPTHVVSTIGRVDELTLGSDLVDAVAAQVANGPPDHEGVVDLYLAWPDAPATPEEASETLGARLAEVGFTHQVRRVAVAVCSGDDRPVGYFTFRPQSDTTMAEDSLVRGVHPMVGRRLNLWRLREFDVTRLEAPEDVLLYRCVAPGNDADQRLVALAQVRQVAVVRDDAGEVVGLPHVERAIANCLEGIRWARAAAPSGARLDLNYVWVHVWPPIDADIGQLTALKDRFAPATSGAGVEEVLVDGTIASPDGAETPMAARFHYQARAGVVTSLEGPPSKPLQPLDDYTQKVMRARRRGVVYPYEMQDMIAGPGGTVTEYDLDDTGKLVPVDRPYGHNKAGIITGVITTPTERYPEGMTRVLLCGDPLRALGAVSEAECSRIIAAL
ncbi:MAG TPA: biotin carboxylase N-terminal domain-containing protein, partial [Nocardioidaceae bacterium]|nr:biotin carboxylase N-terminal domain-containing protein [Nocardioidaceae bacterium]